MTPLVGFSYPEKTFIPTMSFHLISPFGVWFSSTSNPEKRSIAVPLLSEPVSWADHYVLPISCDCPSGFYFQKQGKGIRPAIPQCRWSISMECCLPRDT